MAYRNYNDVKTYLSGKTKKERFMGIPDKPKKNNNDNLLEYIAFEDIISRSTIIGLILFVLSCLGGLVFLGFVLNFHF